MLAAAEHAGGAVHVHGAPERGPALGHSRVRRVVHPSPPPIWSPPLAPFNFKTHDLSGTCIFWLLEVLLHTNTKHTHILHSIVIISLEIRSVCRVSV